MPVREDIIRFYAVIEYIVRGTSSAAVRAHKWTWPPLAGDRITASYALRCSLRGAAPDPAQEMAVWTRELTTLFDGGRDRPAYQMGGTAHGVVYFVDDTPRDAPPTAEERAASPFVERAERFVARFGRAALFKQMPGLLVKERRYPVYRTQIAPDAAPVINPKTLRPFTNDPRDKRHWRVRFDAFCTLC